MRPRILALAAVLANCALAANAQQPLGIGTMGQGTQGYAMGAAIAKVLQEKGGLSSRIQPSSGTSAYLPLIDSGELDFGVANVQEAQNAASGETMPNNRKLENLRFAATLFPFRVGLFVRKDSGIEKIADLKGKRVSYGFSTQSTSQQVVDGLLANGGLKRSDVREGLVPDVVRGAEDLAAGKLDATFFAIGGGKVAEVDAAVGGVRFLPMATDAASVKRMIDAMPPSYISVVQPRPGMAGVEKPIPAMAYDYMLLTGKHVPAATVTKAVETLAENKEALVATLAAFADFDKARMAMDAGLPPHPGAKAYFDKAGIKGK